MPVVVSPRAAGDPNPSGPACSPSADAPGPPGPGSLSDGEPGSRSPGSRTDAGRSAGTSADATRCRLGDRDRPEGDQRHGQERESSSRGPPGRQAVRASGGHPLRRTRPAACRPSWSSRQWTPVSPHRMSPVFRLSGPAGVRLSHVGRARRRIFRSTLTRGRDRSCTTRQLAPIPASGATRIGLRPTIRVRRGRNDGGHGCQARAQGGATSSRRARPLPTAGRSTADAELAGRGARTPDRPRTRPRIPSRPRLRRLLGRRAGRPAGDRRHGRGGPPQADRARGPAARRHHLQAHGPVRPRRAGRAQDDARGGAHPLRPRHALHAADLAARPVHRRRRARTQAGHRAVGGAVLLPAAGPDDRAHLGAARTRTPSASSSSASRPRPSRSSAS